MERMTHKNGSKYSDKSVQYAAFTFNLVRRTNLNMTKRRNMYVINSCISGLTTKLFISLHTSCTERKLVHCATKMKHLTSKFQTRSSVKCTDATIIPIIQKAKGKAIPTQACTGP